MMRTRSQVLAARKNTVGGGCCNRFADMQGCDCLERALPDSVEDVAIDFNKLTIDQISKIRRDCEQHMETWFGFSQAGKLRRTPEFEASTKWRLEGIVEPCCECGQDYPRADLHFQHEIYCKSCREKS